VKLRAGLFEKGRPSARALANPREVIGAPEHRAVAREAVRKSLVLLKNSKSVLPLRPKLNVLVAGDGADDIGKQSGGWTVSWQGGVNSNADFPGGTSIYAGIRSTVTAAGGTATLSPDGSTPSKPDVAIVVFGENPYAEWHGDLRSLDRSGPYRAESIPAPEASAIGASCEKSDGAATMASAAPTTRSAPANARRPSEPSATSANATASSASSDLALLRNLKARGIPVVAVFLTGRPLWITPELEASDAFIVAWLPGTEGAGIADVLFRKPNGQPNYDFTGKLSYSWPRTPADTHVNRGDPNYSPLFAYGFGLSYQPPATTQR
jgi:beta-glucosidase